MGGQRWPLRDGRKVGRLRDWVLACLPCAQQCHCGGLAHEASAEGVEVALSALCLVGHAGQCLQGRTRLSEQAPLLDAAHRSLPSRGCVQGAVNRPAGGVMRNPPGYHAKSVTVFL